MDSGSSDDSVSWALSQGIDVVQLDEGTPFTAARAHATGFRHLRKTAPEIAFCQFIDGDCISIISGRKNALGYLATRPNLAAVCGRRREKCPEKSVYNGLCDREWDTPIGEARYFGGDVMMRVAALDQVGGYRDDLIAGEEPELCVRLRGADWVLWRLSSEMTLHDANMTSFTQWWRRTVRSGYAFAQGAHLHGAPPERHWLWESRRAWLWGTWLPALCLTMSAALWPWGRNLASVSSSITASDDTHRGNGRRARKNCFFSAYIAISRGPRTGPILVALLAQQENENLGVQVNSSVCFGLYWAFQVVAGIVHLKCATTTIFYWTFRSTRRAGTPTTAVQFSGTSR